MTSWLYTANTTFYDVQAALVVEPVYLYLAALHEQVALIVKRFA